MESVLLDVAGHRRSPATMPGYHRGRPPRNKGQQYPADPSTVEEIVAVMSALDDGADGHRLRALVVLLWRAGVRISEATWRGALALIVAPQPLATLGARCWMGLRTPAGCLCWTLSKRRLVGRRSEPAIPRN
jgi:hypothetical protein